MLRLRVHHVLLAVLLHAGVVMLLWWPSSLLPTEAPQPPEEERPMEQPLPQRLVILPPSSREAGSEGMDEPEMNHPIDYAGDAPSRESVAPDASQDKLEEDGPLPSPEESVMPPILDQAHAYARYLREVLAPALGEPSPTGMQAPAYTVRALGDTLVQEMLRAGYARLVVNAGAAFFLAEEQNGQRRFRRIADLPGYARRALLLRSASGQAIARAFRREYGYAREDIRVLFVPSAALDRLILAKQALAVRRLKIPLQEVRLTEGRLVRHGGAFTFLVEQVVLPQGRLVTVEDDERRFVETP